MAVKLLVIDNYDSFTYNLVQIFKCYDVEIRVRRSDKISLNDIETMAPNYILISPGPKDPAHAGISIALIKAFYREIPILGVCLGMQCMNEAFGGKTVRAPIPMHGKTSRVYHQNGVVFKGLSSPFKAARYHSLMVAPPGVGDPELEITARSDDGVIMGLSHKEYPLHGVQFHPESFLTDHGNLLVENFMGLGPINKIHHGGSNEKVKLFN